jgi:hypothetical protein
VPIDEHRANSMKDNHTVSAVQRVHDYRAGHGEVSAPLDRTRPLRERGGDGGFSSRHSRRHAGTRPELLNGGGASALDDQFDWAVMF